MGWHASLSLHYRRDTAGGTTAFDRHEGPLRVLQRLYPEGRQVCHHVIVHPPGGIVGGDRLDVELRLAEGTHALLTTPGASRFYRSQGEEACQSVRAELAEGARLEWLPLETIAYSGSLAANRQAFRLSPGAEMIGWDLLALGLPAAGQPFERGCFRQRLEVVGAWLEQGRIDAADRRLLDSPVGFAGRPVLATLWFAAGTPLAAPRRERLLEAAHAIARAHPLSETAGCSAVQPGVVVVRVLAPAVEPAFSLLASTWAAWRRQAWDLPACPPRSWRT